MRLEIVRLADCADLERVDRRLPEPRHDAQVLQPVLPQPRPELAVELGPALSEGLLEDLLLG